MAAQAFLDHMATGLTTVARCWRLTRRDGWVRGFTDHDRDLTFDGTLYAAASGLSAQTVMQTTGLSIDNSEALGALSDAAISEADIQAGRFDGAEVEAWLVNWVEPDQRQLQFRGRLGEIARSGGAFRAELLGLSAALNQPQGRVFQRACSAVLGDARCRFDLETPGYAAELVVIAAEDGVRFVLEGGEAQPDRFFERGVARVLDGPGAGLSGGIKNDRTGPAGREIDLWQSLRANVAPGDRLRLEAGCDKSRHTCVEKFDNLLNFRGFPDIPGEARLLSLPVRGSTIDETGGAK